MPDSPLRSPVPVLGTTVSPGANPTRKRKASSQHMAPDPDDEPPPGHSAPAGGESSSHAAAQQTGEPSTGLGSSQRAATPQLKSSFEPVAQQESGAEVEPESSQAARPPPPKKGRTNTPWTPAEEKRLKQMRDDGRSWSEIAKTFPARTEGSVKKHWYKDMHYADFAEDDSAALLAAIKEYEAGKWKAIGLKVGKPAKACEQYAKEHFGGRI